MDYEKIKIHKDIISPKVLEYYTADEYIKYYNDLIDILQNAIADDKEERKRMELLIDPKFSDYTKKNFGSVENLKYTANATAIFLHMSTKILKALELFRDSLIENRTATEAIAAVTVKKTDEPKTYMPTPLTHDINPREIKK